MNLKEEQIIKSALLFAEKKHSGQKRIGGEPYITHPKAVAKIISDKGYGSEYIITALFHDLLEDTDATEQEIELLGGKRVLKTVKLLTKTDKTIMSDYISGIKSDPMAFAVKGADRLHNLRTAECADKSFKLRYIKETRLWYMDFMPEIPEALNALENSL